MRRIIRSSRYERAAARLFRPSVQQELEESIAAEPELHPLIPGTGDVVKRAGDVLVEAKAAAFE